MKHLKRLEQLGYVIKEGKDVYWASKDGLTAKYWISDDTWSLYDDSSDEIKMICEFVKFNVISRKLKLKGQ